MKKGILRKRSTPRLVNRKPVSHYETTMSHSQSSSLNRFDETGTGTGSVILDGLVEQGLMAFVKGWDNNTLGITDEGKQAKIWDAKEGVCIGRQVVDEVKEWTEPGNGNQKVVRVSYTWKLADVPSWVDKKAFSSVKGMNEPEDGMINLVKTSNGWKAI